MRAVIHQPYFIPWLGYFSKLAHSDVFIVLDNVYFRKRHFLDRTKIINMHGQPTWLSLPTGDNYATSISNVTTHGNKCVYINTIIRTIEYSYARAKHYRTEWPRLRNAI